MKPPPRVLARIACVLYLIIIVGGIFGEAFIRNGVIVPGYAAATAANLGTMESLWCFGIASEIFMLTYAMVMAWIFFVLLRPVSRDLACLATFFRLISTALEAANEGRGMCLFLINNLNGTLGFPRPVNSVVRR